MLAANAALVKILVSTKKQKIRRQNEMMSSDKSVFLFITIPQVCRRENL